MADDDKNTGVGGGADDPWAGLDPDAAAGGAQSFDFPEFESPLDAPTAAPEPPATAEDPDGEVASGPGEGEPFGVPAFDALSLGAQDGVFTDEAGWSEGDPFAGADDTSSIGSETPLAVFPPTDAGLAAEDQSLLAGDHESLGGGVDPFAGADDADALAHLEDASETESDLGVVAFAQPEPESAAGSSPFGATESLVVGDIGSGDDGAGDGDSLGGQLQIDGSSIQIGTGQSGIVPFDDWGDSPDETGTDVSTSASGDENPFGEPSFDAIDGVDPAAGLAAAVGVATAAGGAAAAAPVRRVIKKRSGGGGIAAVVSVLLGGVLSIPIVIGLLFWVFKKDPFQIAPKIPASLAFLLPAEFQVAGQGSRPFPSLAGRDRTVTASRSLENLVTDGAASEADPSAASPSEGNPPREPAGDDAGSTASKPIEPDDLAASDPLDSPKAGEPKRSTPLDTSALDDAVTAADDVTSKLLGASEKDPAYKSLLKDWYTALAKVGEETVSLEQQASESGSEFVAASPAVRRTIGRILADDVSAGQFARLSRMWLKSRGRSSDGVVLPAVFESSRKVGAWWVSRVRVSDDPAVPEVAILSRSQPDASEGDAVVVLGLVFEPGVVWAAVCGRFEPVAAENAPAADETPSPAPSRGDDLFPLE